jgi:hypothetical protein
MPKDQIDYLMTEVECLAAIVAFKETKSVPDWLFTYKELYRIISIKPEGLPEVIDMHFGGEEFLGIQKFGNLYKVVRSIFVDK